MNVAIRTLVALALLETTAVGQTGTATPESALNPTIQRIVSEVSEERIAADMKKLEGFGTRNVLSDSDDAHGIEAARRWIHQELESYSPKLKVGDQAVHVKKGTTYRPRVFRDVDITNVVAVLPGVSDPDTYVLVTAHYDSVNMQYGPKLSREQRVADLMKRGMDENEAKRVVELFPSEDAVHGEFDPEGTGAQKSAPGVSDDGSGVAAVLELARVMSRYQFDKSVVFVAFAGEEMGLEGTKAYAAEARSKATRIEAVLNNDIIGNDVSGDGMGANNVVRVFGEGPEDSPSRALLRYTHLLAERYVPSMKVEMVFHRDRFSRGGDHTSFSSRGYAAVRLTTASENYENQHTSTDTFANASAPYTARVARMNAAVLASLALAPPAPVVNYTYQSGERKGDRAPLLSRGRSGYDAALRWVASPASDVAGYAVVMRATTAPDWEREIWVGNTTSFILKDLSIDDTVLGVKAVDRDGNQSLVAAYLETVTRLLTGEPAAGTSATGK
jgi:hypothetical protein